MIESFQWNEQFATGLPEVDSQHQELVSLINRYGDSLATGSPHAQADLQTVFANLADYARFHFATEEQLMVQLNLDPRHISRHQEQHRAFIQKLTKMRSHLDDEDMEENRRVMKFMVRWLANHILGTDQIMGRQVVAVQASVSPQEAYRITEQGNDDREFQTEPLIHALNELYQEVAERNRELIALNQSLEAKVAERTAELLQANQQLEALAMTDQLTGLPNRRHAIARLAQLWQESCRNNRPFSLMLIDADGFKPINDNWGHDTGDLVLQKLSYTLRDTVRNDDLACRLGGDEFLILCPNTPLIGALHLGELLRQTVTKMHVSLGAGAWHGSISVGVAERRSGMTHYEELIKVADESMYLAKQRGRNRVASVQEV